MIWRTSCKLWWFRERAGLLTPCIRAARRFVYLRHMVGIFFLVPTWNTNQERCQCLESYELTLTLSLWKRLRLIDNQGSQLMRAGGFKWLGVRYSRRYAFPMGWSPLIDPSITSLESDRITRCTSIWCLTSYLRLCRPGFRNVPITHIYPTSHARHVNQCRTKNIVLVERLASHHRYIVLYTGGPLENNEIFDLNCALQVAHSS
jgi:hypothetical protein